MVSWKQDIFKHGGYLVYNGFLRSVGLKDLVYHENEARYIADTISLPVALHFYHLITL